MDDLNAQQIMDPDALAMANQQIHPKLFEVMQQMTEATNDENYTTAAKFLCFTYSETTLAYANIDDFINSPLFTGLNPRTKAATRSLLKKIDSRGEGTYGN